MLRTCTPAQVTKTSLSDRVPWGEGTFGSCLLEPTRIYVKDVLKMHKAVGLKVRAQMDRRNSPGICSHNQTASSIIIHHDCIQHHLTTKLRCQDWCQHLPCSSVVHRLLNNPSKDTFCFAPLVLIAAVHTGCCPHYWWWFSREFATRDSQWPGMPR